MIAFVVTSNILRFVFISLLFIIQLIIFIIARFLSRFFVKGGRSAPPPEAGRPAVIGWPNASFWASISWQTRAFQFRGLTRCNVVSSHMAIQSILVKKGF
jgi:hypothetical protein